MKARDICTTDLSDAIRIEQQTGAEDDMGGRVDDWSLVFDAWAMVVPMTGTEVMRQNKLDGSTMYTFYIRWSRELIPEQKHRIVWTEANGVTRYLNIRSVIDVENKHMFYELIAEEGPGT